MVEPLEARDHRAQADRRGATRSRRRRRPGRRPGRDREHDRTDAEDEERGRDDVEPGADHARQAGSTPCVSAPTHAMSPASERRDHDAGRGERQASAQHRDAPDRLGQQVHETPRRLLLGGRADLARREQRDHRRDEQERDAEVLPQEACPARRTCRACRGSSREPRRSPPWRRSPNAKRRAGRPDAPGRRARAARAERQPERRAEAERCGAGRRHARRAPRRRRRDARPARVDATTSTTPSTAASTSGRGSLSVSGRMRSVQPNGVSHSSHSCSGRSRRSCARRTRRRTRAMPSAVASRRVRPSCDVSAPTPTNTAAAEHDARAVEHGLADPEADVRVPRRQQRDQRSCRRRARRPRRRAPPSVAAVAARRACARRARAANGRRPPRRAAAGWRRGGPRSRRSS